MVNFEIVYHLVTVAAILCSAAFTLGYHIGKNSRPD